MLGAIAAYHAKYALAVLVLIAIVAAGHGQARARRLLAHLPHADHRRDQRGLHSATAAQ